MRARRAWRGRRTRARKIRAAGLAAGVVVAAGWLAGCGEGAMEPTPVPPPPPTPPPNRPPQALGALPAAALAVGDTLSFSLSDLFRDPDGDELAFTARATPSGVATATAGTDQVTVTGTAPGATTLTVTARDPGGLSAALSSALTVRPANRAPTVADTMPARTLTAGVSLTIDLSAYFRDPDGDSLTYAAASSDAGVATASATDATLSLAAVSRGTATITVTAQDAEGLTVAQGFEVTVNPPNRPPAVADTISVETLRPGESVTVDVSGAFRDPDGDTLAYAVASRDTGVVRASVTGVTLTVTARTVGATTVTVTARDPEGLSADQDIRVAVETPNRAPEAVEMLAPRRLPAGEAETLDVSPYFRDPDGDTLTFAATTTNSDVAWVSVTGAALTINGASPGTVTLTVTARDPGGFSAAQSTSVVIGPPNHWPQTVDEIPAQSLFAGETLRLDVSRYFRDPDGDLLVYSAASTDNGVVTASLSDSLLTLTGVAAGMAAIAVTASDPRGREATQEFTVTVAAVRPDGFRDDFDAFDRTVWATQRAAVTVRDGILSVRNTTSGFRGVVTRDLEAPITSWEVRASMGRSTTENTDPSLVFFTGHARYLAYAFNLGSGVSINGEETNYRFYLFDAQGQLGPGWYLVRDTYGRSEEVRDGASELTEVAVSLRDQRLRVQAGAEELFEFRIRADLPTDLVSVGVWVVPRQGATGRTALFDWIEVTGLRREDAAGVVAGAEDIGAGAASTDGPSGESRVPVWVSVPEMSGAGVGIEPTTCGLKVRCSTN